VSATLLVFLSNRLSSTNHRADTLPIAFQLVTGRVWRGCAFGGIKGRSQLPDLVSDYLHGKLKVDEFITHRKKLGEMNDAFEVMKSGDCIRAVVDMREV
jgi:S-(hydroxymethyl)glutathione dehydrogenase/alcohol dehydrogenase